MKKRKRKKAGKTQRKQRKKKITTENVIDLMLMHEQSGHVSKQN